MDAQNLITRFGHYSAQPAIRQLALLFGLAASIALAVGLVQWSMTADYAPLYGQLSAEDTGEVISLLENAGIEYRLSDRSGLIMVPAEQVHEARLRLASEGFPRSDGSGFDVLYREQEMGISSFMERARFDRALEQELAQSIASMDSVRSARVHLALPKPSAFLRKRDKPAASVLLNLYAGRRLTDRQLAGVVHLVSSSVPSLQAEHVSVVDNNGALLSNQNLDEEFGFTKEQFRFSQQLEQRYTARIVEILTPILGPDAVHAQVAADIDFTRIERTSESYAPESRVRSEQLSEEVSQNRFNGGVPGTLTNQPPLDTVVSNTQPEGNEQTSRPERSSKQETRNYEMDKTISHIRETPGSLRKLSVAVVVDYQAAPAGNTENGTEGDAELPASVPLSEQRLAEVTALVREAVGFDEARGDTVSVINASFVAIPALAAPLESSILEQEWLWRAAKLGLTGLVLLLLVLLVLRPMMRFSGAPLVPGNPALGGPAGEPGAAGRLEGDAIGEDQVTLGGQSQLGLPAGDTGYQHQLQMARTMAEGEPHRAAHIVKDWVAADG